ncbi:sigma-70 family RNA polymerase sigma factor [Nocardioides mangrovi]|uniref:Sigma-70 family RNA polymerase sigma factor n=1 Tax=Nocardioides mangrovi TaxID=2874580 RepID=A0ABS7UDI1_9ACTN|nr:sigma-70 family RNA polymerase sigma factor [Nocardioides mangrovi]MBZ5739060.1 sigma-70 family RNA polymerase sigma factor [Nocardioides mangrovi]
MTRSEAVTHADTSAARPVDPAALAEQHVPLVAHLVREVSARIPATVDRDDLRSAGLVALVMAAQSFDPELGVPFPAYAGTRIRGALLDELRSIDWASRSVRRRGREIEATRQRLANALGAFPDDAKVAEAMGVSVADINRADADVSRATVLSIHATEDGTLDLPESRVLGPAEVCERTEQLEYLADAISELPERLQMVVRGYFLEQRPMAEIGELLGVTESRVSQLRAEALVLLRRVMTEALEPQLAEAPADRAGVAERRKAEYVDSVVARHAARRVPTVAVSA